MNVLTQCHTKKYQGLSTNGGSVAAATNKAHNPAQQRDNPNPRS